MSQTIFIFHGTEGNPQKNWYPWLKNELEERGYKVIVPQFPSPPVVAAKVDEWFKVLRKYETDINEKTIIVGHSLGGIFALRVLELYKPLVRAVFLVGTPIGERPILNYNRDNNFSGFEFDWETIKRNSQDFTVYHSDNDSYVGIDNGIRLASNLGVKLSLIPNAGHFTATTGYTTFEELRDRLISTLDPTKVR